MPATRVGPYELLTRIGEGGMGVVHLARAADGHRVALKVLRTHIVGDQEARERLAREVGSLQRIRSRWVAEILDADPWAEVPYIATRYIPGLSLHDHVQQEGPISGDDLTWFASCLAEGLVSVHGVGVLHRDVKPSNVLMEGRTPILIDFGLARVADDPRLTHTGWLLGTPGYLAPEILHGDDATAASDVHSWAATVAYAGTGHAPFGRGPSMAIMDRVRRGEHDLSGLPPELARLLTVALDPDPHRRPTLATVLATLRSEPGAETLVVPTPAASPTLAYSTLLPEVEAADLADYPIRVSMAERARRAMLLVSVAVIAGVSVAAYPWPSGSVLLVLGWLLRSGSHAASATGDRQRVRGRRWYDGLRLVFSTPWHLIRSIGSTVLLELWGIGIGASAGLVSFAINPSTTTALFVGAVAFAIGVWTGPGGSRVRSPLARAARPVARETRTWAIALVVVVLLIAAGGIRIAGNGTDWTPGDGRPFADH